MEISRDKEKQRQLREMDVESLAKLVFRLLKESVYLNHPHRYDFSSTFLGIRENLFPDAELTQYRHDHVHLLEAVVLLEKRGLVVRDFSYPPTVPKSREKEIPGTFDRDESQVISPLDRFGVHLTSIGIKTKWDEISLLVDRPQETVDSLEQKIGTLDNVVKQYYLESLRAYQEGLYIASVLCLGVASERAIHWLAESIESHSEQYQEEIEKRRSGKIFRLTEYLSDTVIPHIFGDDNKFRGELKNRLNELGKIYRENRNKAGHPRNVVPNWPREDQEILLIQFRRYITTIYKAIEECQAKTALRQQKVI